MDGLTPFIDDYVFYDVAKHGKKVKPLSFNSVKGTNMTHSYL